MSVSTSTNPNKLQSKYTPSTLQINSPRIASKLIRFATLTATIQSQPSTYVDHCQIGANQRDLAVQMALQTLQAQIQPLPPIPKPWRPQPTYIIYNNTSYT